MRRKILGTMAVTFVLAWPGHASAALCPKCHDLMFVDSVGKCSSCGGATSSGALKLCSKCSASQHKCEHCLAKVEAADTPAVETPATPPPAEKPPVETPTIEKMPAEKLTTEKPPAELPSAQGVPIEKLPESKPPTTPSAEKPLPIDLTKSGTYAAGKWQYRLDIVEPGTKSEGRWGWLWYDSQKLPRGEVNDYYRTPWGPIYWVDVPKTHWGMHGWMPSPLAQNSRQGQPLTAPSSSTAGPQSGRPPAASSQTTQPPLSPQTSKPQSLELTKADNGKRARVRVGNIIVIRLPGNPTTGYQWQSIPMPNPVVRLIGQPQFAPHPQRPNTVGSGGIYTFTFQVIQPGTGAIRLAYSRPWEKNRAAADTFGIGVEVLPSPATGPTRSYGMPSPPTPTRSPTYSGVAPRR